MSIYCDSSIGPNDRGDIRTVEKSRILLMTLFWQIKNPKS